MLTTALQGRWVAGTLFHGWKLRLRSHRRTGPRLKFGLCLSGPSVWTLPHLRAGGRDTGREGRRVSEIEAASGGDRHIEEVAVWPAPQQGRWQRLAERRTPLGTWWVPSFAGNPEQKRPETHI